MKNLSFMDFYDLTSQEEGIVLLGTGGDLNEWVEGVSNILRKEGIAEGEELFEEPMILTTSGGRTDMALVFNKSAKFEMGRLAMWRLRFGDCSWISDYKVNYAEQHGIEIIDSDEK